MKKTIYFIVKWLPITALVLLNIINILIMNLGDSCQYLLFNYMFGNSILFSIFLYVLSSVLQIGLWNRILIITNLGILLIGFTDYFISLKYGSDFISNWTMFNIDISISLIGIVLSIIFSLRDKRCKV